ncbi:MAG: hypothetical protein ACO1NU_05075 [Arcticibacter sp.]
MLVITSCSKDENGDEATSKGKVIITKVSIFDEHFANFEISMSGVECENVTEMGVSWTQVSDTRNAGKTYRENCLFEMGSFYSSTLLENTVYSAVAFVTYKDPKSSKNPVTIKSEQFSFRTP